MEHPEAAPLLAAYALGAVGADEAAALEEHLLSCSLCRAALAAYREVVGALDNRRLEDARDVWNHLHAELEASLDYATPSELRLLSALCAALAQSKPRSRRYALFAASAAVLVIGLLSFEVLHLNHEVEAAPGRSTKGQLAPVVAEVLSGPHRTIELDAADRSSRATVAVGSNGIAYWVSSNLGALPSNMTYQLWSISRGRTVSLGVLGPNPSAYATFRLQRSVTELMVTIEPEGGTPAPTTPTLIKVSLPPS